MLVHRCDMCKKDIKKAYYTIKVNVETINDADLDINELNSGYIRYSAVPLGCEIELCRDCFMRRDNFLKRNSELDY